MRIRSARSSRSALDDKPPLSSASTPTVTVVNNSITAIKSAALTADTTKELLTQPLIVEGGTTLTIQSSNTGSFDFAVSYLNILKEKVD